MSQIGFATIFREALALLAFKNVSIRKRLILNNRVMMVLLFAISGAYLVVAMRMDRFLTGVVKNERCIGESLDDAHRIRMRVIDALLSQNTIRMAEFVAEFHDRVKKITSTLEVCKKLELNPEEQGIVEAVEKDLPATLNFYQKVVDKITTGDKSGAMALLLDDHHDEFRKIANPIRASFERKRDRTTAYYDRSHDLLVSLNAMCLLFTILAGSFGVWWARRVADSITFPLDDIAANLTDSAKGNFDNENLNELSMYQTDKNEIGSLARAAVSFRDAAITLLKLRNDHAKVLEQWNDNLAKEIAQRTAELEVALNESDAASRAKSNFLNCIAHELRTPLNALVLAGLMADDETLNDSQRQYFRFIDKSSKRLTSIVGDILDVSSARTEKTFLDIKNVTIKWAIDSVVDLLKIEAMNKGVILETVIDDTCPPIVLSNRGYIQTITKRLVENAVKFTEHGKVEIVVTYERDDAKETSFGNLVIRVTDTGIGIPSARQNDIFEPFVQGDSSPTRKYGGLGLGLALCKELSEAVGGHVCIETSAPGKGTTFRASIPCSVACQATDS